MISVNENIFNNADSILNRIFRTRNFLYGGINLRRIFMNSFILCKLFCDAAKVRKIIAAQKYLLSYAFLSVNDSISFPYMFATHCYLISIN